MTEHIHYQIKSPFDSSLNITGYSPFPSLFDSSPGIKSISANASNSSSTNTATINDASSNAYANMSMTSRDSGHAINKKSSISSSSSSSSNKLGIASYRKQTTCGAEGEASKSSEDACSPDLRRSLIAMGVVEGEDCTLEQVHKIGNLARRGVHPHHHNMKYSTLIFYFTITNYRSRKMLCFELLMALHKGTTSRK